VLAAPVAVRHVLLPLYQHRHRTCLQFESSRPCPELDAVVNATDAMDAVEKLRLFLTQPPTCVSLPSNCSLGVMCCESCGRVSGLMRSLRALTVTCAVAVTGRGDCRAVAGLQGLRSSGREASTVRRHKAKAGVQRCASSVRGGATDTAVVDAVPSDTATQIIHLVFGEPFERASDARSSWLDIGVGEAWKEYSNLVKEKAPQHRLDAIT
jgi:hypothetical protein